MLSVLHEKVQFPSIKVALGRQAGEGAFSFVFEAKEAGISTSGRRFAVKKLLCQSEEQVREAEHEVKVLRKLQEIGHVNLLPLLDSTSVNNKAGHMEYYLLLPLYYASVQQMIDAGPGYPHSAFRSGELYDISMGVLEGLEAIHSLGFRHCDLKPANVLLTHDHMPVIIDFGSACDVRTVVDSRKKALEVQEYASIHSTISFRAPELLDTPSECVIDEASDVWAYGCTIYAMLCSRTPFETPTEGVTPLAILSAKFSHPSTDGNTPTTSTEFLRSVVDASLVADTASRATLETLKGLFPRQRSASDAHIFIDTSNDGGNVEDGKNDVTDQATEQRRSGRFSPMGSPRAGFAITTIPEDEAVLEENRETEVAPSTVTMRINVEVRRMRGFPKRLVKKTAHLMMTYTSITLLKGGMHQSHRNLKFYGTTILGRAVTVQESDTTNFEYGLIISGEPFLLQQEFANGRGGGIDDVSSVWEVGFPSAAARTEWITEIKKRCVIQIQERNERRSTMGRRSV